MPVGGNGNHLFVVCTNPCAAGKVVLANISSWKGDKCDPTVRFPVGTHPFITKNSYVVFNFAEVERCMTIEAGERQGRFVRREPFPEPDLSQIEAGLLASRFTPKKVKKYISKNVHDDVT